MLRQFSRGRFPAFFSHHSEASYVVPSRHDVSHSPRPRLPFRYHLCVCPKRKCRHGTRHTHRSFRRSSSQRTDPSGEPSQRFRPSHDHQHTGPVCLLQCAFQPLPHQHARQRFRSVESERRDSFVSGYEHQAHSPCCWGQRDRNCGGFRGSGRRRSHLSHRCRPRPFYQGAARKSVLYAQFSRHTLHSRRRGRFQRALPRPRRPRIQLVLHRWPVHHRPAEQGLLQSTARKRRPVS